MGLIHVTIERMYSERLVAIDGVLLMEHACNGLRRPNLIRCKVIDNRVINCNFFFFHGDVS